VMQGLLNQQIEVCQSSLERVLPRDWEVTRREMLVPSNS
jgi:hypothetical protein